MTPGAPPVEISYSRLRAYLDCPWKFKLLFVDRRRFAPTAPSSLGGSLHRALAAFYGAKGSTLEELLDAYEDRWLHVGFESPQQQAEFHEKGRKILERYWREVELERKSRILFVEKEFSFALGPCLVRGIIDRIDERPDGTIEVIDYKSQQEPQGEDAVARNLQLRIYGLAAREAMGLKPGALSILYLSACRSVSVPYEEGREAEVRELLSANAARMASGDHEPDTRHCHNCPFRNRCEHSVARDLPSVG